MPTSYLGSQYWPQYLLDVSKLSSQAIFSFFLRVQQIKAGGSCHFLDNSLKPCVFLIFFEPSTRTILSFQRAISRLGFDGIVMPPVERSSMVKGESEEETLSVISAMNPDLIVVRTSKDKYSEEVLAGFSCPIISAGNGKSYHPTQALLDVYTLWETWDGELQGKTLFIFGDILHSRVAHSSGLLCESLGMNVLWSASSGARPEGWDLSQEVSFDEGLRKADAVMGLRTQVERHESQSIRTEMRLDGDTIKNLSKGACILHPGPVLWGSEFDLSLRSYPGLLIQEQVKNGVWVRCVLLEIYMALQKG